MDQAHLPFFAETPTDKVTKRRMVGVELTLQQQGKSDDPVAWSLGWDHAHYGVVPPASHLLPQNPVRQGWEAGRRVFHQRTLPATSAVQAWLTLRLEAWLHGRHFEEIQLTPNYLAQLQVERCPITRKNLVAGTTDATPSRLARLHGDAGYAAGHLALLSVQGAQAMARRHWADAQRMASLAESSPTGDVDGLNAHEWARLATLMSFVTPLPHVQAASLPLRVLPPNRLRLLNPIQGLQALLTRQLSQDGFAARLARLAELLPRDALRSDFHRVVHALLPRIWDGGKPLTSLQWRERLEDAWAAPLLQKCWLRLALQLSADEAERMVFRAVAEGLLGATQQVLIHPARQATDGWALETHGYA